MPCVRLWAVVLLSSLVACSSTGAPAGSDANGGASAGGGSAGGGAPIAGAGNGGAPSAAGTSAGGAAAGGRPANGVTPGASGAAGTSGGAGGVNDGAGGMSGSASPGGATSGGSGGTGSSVPSLRIVGRTAPGAGSAIRLAWPGVNVHGRFSGTQVSLTLNDNAKNRFSVVIDGGAPKTVTAPNGQASLLLASGLGNGTHEISIWRNTEASGGVTQLTGLSNFSVGGELLAPAVAPDRRLEVIGDSLSVGAGVEGNAACPGGIDAFTNNYLAYGSVAARAVSADVVTIAWSGIGVYRNYDGSTSNTMPARYPYSIPNDQTAWDFSRYQPQVVVVNLGTNDFGQGDPGVAYETAYVEFIKSVRSKYASASFILIDMYGGTRLTRINNVISKLKTGGEAKIEALSVSSAQNNLGCNQHPNVAGQAAMGAVLAQRLKSLMGW